MKLNTILTFNDNNIGIVLFNDEKIILFQDKVALTNKLIINGLIVNPKIITNLLQKMIADAERFTKTKITSVNVNFDVTDIEIKPFKHTDVRLNSGIFNKLQWDIIKNGFKVVQGANKYIFDVNYDAWYVDGKKQLPTDNNIVGTKLDVEANMLQMNKVTYNQYAIILKKLNLNIDYMKPMICSFINLIRHTKRDYHELFVYINKSHISIMLTDGNIIRRCVNDSSYGLNSLFERIQVATQLDMEYIETMLSNIWSYFGTLKNVNIINSLSECKLIATTTQANLIDDVIQNFIKELTHFVETNANFLRANYDINVSCINYLGFTKLTSQMLNHVNIHSKLNNQVVTNDYAIEYGDEFTQEWLLINSVIREKLSTNNNYTTNKKEIKTSKLINKE
ncbi:MAG: hypothetical protein ACRC42_02160 [Mycoplasma sp.]